MICILTIILLAIYSNQRQCQLHHLLQNRIRTSLAPFQAGINQTMLQKAKDTPQTCIIKVNHHQVQAPCLRQSQLCFFKSIASHLPDMEFVVNMLDEPRVLKNPCSSDEDWRNCACDKHFIRPNHGFFILPDTWMPVYEHVPIFSPGVISDCFVDILMPSYLHLEWKPSKASIPWKNKQFKAIWRGTSTGGNYSSFNPHYSTFHRQRLVTFCQKITQYCDAKFSGYGECDSEACREMRKTYGQPSFMSMEDQKAYKIIIDIDGSTYSGRYPLLLFSGSVIMKIGIFEDIATTITKKWQHYIPVDLEYSDFMNKMEWSRDHDRQLESIAKRAKILAQSSLNIESYKCYMTRLLLNYYKLVNNTKSYANQSGIQ